MVSRTTLGLLAAVTAVGTVGAYFVLKDRIGPIPGIPSITMKVNPKTVRDGIDPINVEIDIKNLEPNTKYQIVFVIELEPSSVFSLFDQPPIIIFSDSNGNFKNTYQFTFNLGNTKKTQKGITAVLSIPDIVDNFRGATPTQFITILPSTEPEPEPEPTAVIRSFSFNPSSGEKPLNVSFQLEVGDSRSSIEWQFGDGTASVFNNLILSHTYFNSGTFNGKVIVTNPDGRQATKQFSIFVKDPTVIKEIITNFFQGNGSFIGDVFFVPFSISLGIPNSEIKSIEWQFGDGSPTVFSLTSLDHGYKNPGVFNGRVSVLATDGRLESRTFSVFVPDSGPGDPTGEIIVTGKSGNTFTFFANFQGKFPLIYNWNFGDGQKDTGETVTHTFPDAGTYTVRVDVTDPDGNRGNDTVTVTATVEVWHKGDVVIRSISIQDLADNITRIVISIRNDNFFVKGTVQVFMQIKDPSNVIVDLQVEETFLSEGDIDTVAHDFSLPTGSYSLEVFVWEKSTGKAVSFTETRSFSVN